MNDGSIQSVLKSFNNFLQEYDDFRKSNDLPSKIDVYEALAAMSDKHGRICRQVKHAERNDHKEDWPDGLVMALMGYISYSVLLLQNSDIELSDVSSGFKKELLKGVDQHSEGSE